MHAQSSFYEEKEGGIFSSTFERAGKLQDLISHPFGSIKQEIIGKMSVALSGHWVAVTEQLARHHQGFAAHHRVRGECVAIIPISEFMKSVFSLASRRNSVARVGNQVGIATVS